MFSGREDILKSLQEVGAIGLHFRNSQPHSQTELDHGESQPLVQL